MENKKERIETFIKETIEQEAEDIRRENEKEPDTGEMPAEVRDRIWYRLETDIEDYERRERYAELSDEDYRALRLGQDMMEKKKTRKKTARRKRRVMFCGGLAAVLAMVIVVSVNSIGRHERVAQFVTSRVGGREVLKVNSSDENLVIVEEDEEKAYQAMGEEFGVRPLRILTGALENMKFDTMEFDKILQFAELRYVYNDEKIVYFISASFKDSSWATDVDDVVTDEYQMEREGCLIKIREYDVSLTNLKKYTASFKYNGLEYFLTGAMDKEQFEKIIENFYFNS